jgi:hypothetical protein
MAEEGSERRAEGAGGEEASSRPADPVASIHRAIQGPTVTESFWMGVIRVLSIVTALITVRGGARGARAVQDESRE